MAVKRCDRGRRPAGAGAAIVVAATMFGACGLDVPRGNAVVAVPFAVSDQFTASGFMGDGTTPGVVTMSVDDGGCRARPDGAMGSCYRFSYAAPAAGSLGWAGVYWQTPVSNWGQLPGKRIAPGAARVRFWAATEVGGEAIAFRVGGLSGGVDPATGAAYPHGDTFDVEATFTMTAAWAMYEVALPPGVQYDRVLGGFAWSATLAGGSAATIYLDDLRWEP